MPLYEHVFMVRQDVSTAQVETLTDQFKSIIEDNGGKVAKNEYWGVKSLSFKIRKNRKAHYSLMNIDSDHEHVAEMERQMRLNEDVIRFLTLRVDEHEDEPSAMMRSRGGRDRDDRRGPPGGRGPRGGSQDRPDKAPAGDAKAAQSADTDKPKGDEE